MVSNAAKSIEFYRNKLGFETWYQEPENDPFFAIVGRDGAQLFVKAGDAAPLPNAKRDPDMRWAAYVLGPIRMHLPPNSPIGAWRSAIRSKTRMTGCADLS